MSKLFKVKTWVTIPEAATRLSATFGEPVKEAEVLRFCLDGRLKLSFFLVNSAYGRTCSRTDLSTLEWDEFPGLSGVEVLRMPKNGRIFMHGDEPFLVEKTVVDLKGGVWSVPLIGGERGDVEYECQSLMNGPEVTVVSLDSVFIASEAGQLFEVQERFDAKVERDFSKRKPFFDESNFHPAGALPDDGYFVIRTGDLLEFEQTLLDKPKATESEVGTRERNTLLTIIAALCKEAKLDPAKPAKTAGYLRGIMAQMGVDVGESTIESHLKKIPEALQSRST